MFRPFLCGGGGGGALCDQTLCFLYLEFWNYRELATLFTLSENGNPDSLILCNKVVNGFNPQPFFAVSEKGQLKFRLI